MEVVVDMAILLLPLQPAAHPPSFLTRHSMLGDALLSIEVSLVMWFWFLFILCV